VNVCRKKYNQYGKVHMDNFYKKQEEDLMKRKKIEFEKQRKIQEKYHVFKRSYKLKS